MPQPAMPARPRGHAAGKPGRGPQPAAAPDHVNLAGVKTRPVEHQPQRPRREVAHVPGQIQPVPGLTEPAEGQAIDIGNRYDQLSSRHEQAAGGPEHLQRIVHVLQRLPHGDDVEAGIGKGGVRQRAAQGVDAQVGADAANCGGGQIQAGDLPALQAHAIQGGAAATAKIQKPALPVPGQDLALTVRPLPARPPAACFAACG